MRRSGGALLVVGIAALGVAAAAGAAFPGGDGRIAFSRGAGKGDDYDLYTMRPDGTARRALVRSKRVDLDPSWSADGRKVVFVRDVDGRRARANDEIFMKELVSGRITRLTRSRAIDWNPSFSPDGLLVAFSSDRGPGPEYDIHVVDVVTLDVMRIERPGDDFGPVYAFDGTWLYWSGYRPSGRADIFALSPLLAAPRAVTSTPRKSEEEPDASPDGDMLVYQRWGRGARDADPEVVLHDLASGDLDVLTRNRRSDLRPVFSPRGTRIAWERSWDETDVSGQIWTMRLNGKSKKPRTPKRFDADSPAWQPAL